MKLIICDCGRLHYIDNDRQSYICDKCGAVLCRVDDKHTHQMLEHKGYQLVMQNGALVTGYNTVDKRFISNGAEYMFTGEHDSGVWLRNPFMSQDEIQAQQLKHELEMEMLDVKYIKKLLSSIEFELLKSEANHSELNWDI